jgi:ribosomal protein S18 acetylase RimI-like enzyme
MDAIRPAALQDLPGVYGVCLATGDSGRDATKLYRNPDLLGHVFAGPYVVGQPETSFVVADAQGVAGYVLAAEDTRAFESWAESHWWPLLRRQYPQAGGNTPDDQMIRLIHAPPTSSDHIVAEYPAHMHIDLLERVRGRGLGRVLVERLLRTLRDRGSPAVHLGVAADNPNAIAFYRHLGFVVLEREPGSLLMGFRLGLQRRDV